ncbi:hypothetical protein D3C78_739000 [compost metagenome]
MTKGDIVVAGDTFHVALRNRREERHHQTKNQRAGKDQTDTFKPSDRQDHTDHTGHIKSVVAGEEDVFQTRKAGDNNICHHTKSHNQRG